MNIQRLISVLFGLMLFGGLIASSAEAQPTDSSKQNSQVQCLTCVKEPQELNCTNVVQQTTASNEQLGQVSNLLLGIIYFGLPIVLVLAILLKNKREVKRTQLIEHLEHIWKQNPQP